MSRLVARILLAILMIPAAAIVYVVFFAVFERGWRGNETMLFVLSGFIAWVFVAVYWTLLWLGVVRMSRARVMMTALAAVGAAGIGGVFGLLASSVDVEFGGFVGSTVSPIAWLIATTLLWRETADERTERLRVVSKSAVVCPKCGYNLTGLAATRCPECGRQYTLDELLAGQPSRIEADVPA
ncbi:MAG TPA: hypothetical protein VGM98_03925 [Schlesneria sp.]